MRVLVCLLLLSSIHSLGQNWFDDQSIQATVLLEKKIHGVFQPHGTGFLLFNYKNNRQFTLVTCEHVLKNNHIYVSIQPSPELLDYFENSGDSILELQGTSWELINGVLRTRIELVENKTFVRDSVLDIAAFTLGLQSEVSLYNDADTLTLPICNVRGIPKSGMKIRAEVSLGEDVYFLGFPFLIGTPYGMTLPSNAGFSQASGIYSSNVSNPLLRSGSIGWIDSDQREFLLDAFSYGGNSGSPIFTSRKPFGEGPYLIGMVIGHLGEIVEVDENGPELKGNSGLARCLWMDDILKVVERARLLE